jgi:plasmid maintenance system antidote protein VapI
MSRKLKPVSPGEMLAEEFLKPLDLSNYRSASAGCVTLLERVRTTTAKLATCGLVGFR